MITVDDLPKFPWRLGSYYAGAGFTLHNCLLGADGKPIAQLLVPLDQTENVSYLITQSVNMIGTAMMDIEGRDAEIIKSIEQVIEKADADGIHATEDDVVDLLADNICIPLKTIRLCLGKSRFADRFPIAVSRGLKGRMT